LEVIWEAQYITHDANGIFLDESQKDDKFGEADFNFKFELRSAE
jgi:hypothetical protein